MNQVFLRHSKILALILALSIILTSVLGGTFAYIVTGTDSLLNIFISGLAPTGDLTIRKTLTHPFGEGYTIPKGLNFSFQVDLGQDYADGILATSQGDIKADKNGTLRISVAPGAAVTIFDIREGTEATVTEILSHGFSVGNGEDSRTITIPRQGQTLVYANDYHPDPVPYVNVIVSGTKTLLGRDWQEGDIFTFILEQETKTEEGSVWTQVGTSTVEFELIEVEDPDNPGETIWVPAPNFNIFDLTETLQSLDYEAAGTYCFRLSEEFGHVGGITYDSVVSYFDVVVGDADMDGYLEVQSVLGYQNATAGYDSDTEHFLIEVSIENTYAPSGVAPSSIRIQKLMESTSGQAHSAAGFTFELYDENGELVAITDPTSAAGEAFISKTYEAKEAGNTYYYTLKETYCGEAIDGVTYDSTEYHLAVTVIDNLDGTVRAAVYLAEPGDTEVPEDAESSLALTFCNRYDPEDTAVTLGGTKELTGRDLREGEFTFHLYATGADFALAENTKPIQTVRNNAEGGFDFAKLPYDKVGEYHYVITEDATDPLGGVTYDTTRYHVTVTVADVGGKLEATVTVADHNGAESEVIFRNSYRAAGTSAIFDGIKQLTGAELKANAFAFELYDADEDFNILGVMRDKVFNTAEGTFAFKEISYTEPGDYHYVILEDDSEQAEGITYDDTRYGVTVHVRDNGNGSLVAETTIQVLGGSRVDTITFVNTYTEPETSEPTEPEPTEPEPTDPEPTEPEPTEPEPTEPEPTEPEPTEPEPTEPEPTDPEPTEPEPTEPSEPGTSDPTKPTTPGDDPETGDDARLELYLLLMTISLTMLILLALLAKDHRIRTGRH